MKALILGGGISGLSAAWFLHKKHPQWQITLLEKEARLGGAIQTEKAQELFFEKGPRTFATSRSPALLGLIRDLKLDSELLFSDPKSSLRYLWHQGKLRPFSSFLPRFLPLLIRESFLSQKEIEDESIYEFVKDRFNEWTAETLFDPMTLGIYAGNIRALSVRSCFPSLFQQQGSFLRTAFRMKKSSGLFTLRGGMERLIEEIERQLPIEIVRNCAVEAIRDGEVIAGGQIWRAERIFSALPSTVIGRLFREPFFAQSFWVVPLIFKGDILLRKGYGYLIPTQENESLLGMIWDSSIFPQQGVQGETRLTAMVRPEEKEPIEAALSAAKKHLKIRQNPFFASAWLAKEAIPKFEVGYSRRLSQFEERVKRENPSLTLLGNYQIGPSVEACIQNSKYLY